jgi:hypothetical protein
MATGSNLTAAKAVYAAVLGFIAPGVAFLTAQLVGGDGNVSGSDWFVALLFCLGGSAALGGGVFAVENKPKATPPAATGYREPMV